ncbi:MAG: IclR family transcriptional regulator [Spirochaetaceae bacterium]|jgi:DNA-binding IclR family transcriptional regulator|nr:IclR family transcriptional regulator [Spirochaetaceae bacterium]
MKPKKHISDGVKKNQSLRKALQILEGMTKITTPARLQDIAKSLKIPQSTVLRFINTFIDFGYIGQDPNNACYYLTLKLADLGSKARGNFPFQSSLTKYVKEVAAAFDESASLCIEQNMQMIYIATEEGSGRMLQTLYRIGHIAPMHATGVGKLHLLNYSDEKLLELEKVRGFPQYTFNTITNLNSLKKELASIRKQDYALDNEECEEGVRCIAVPVKNYENRVVAGISISAPVVRLDKKKTDDIIRFLKNISIRASREMGWEE